MCGSTQGVEGAPLLREQVTKSDARVRIPPSAPTIRGDGRAAEGTGLENRRRETVRGFESYSPRQRKNIINLLTFTNECVILISSSEPNKKTSLGSSTVESNKVCLRCGFNSHLRANKEVWTKLLHLIIGSEKIIINY